MAVEQAYEAFGLYLPRFLSDQAVGVVYNGVGEGLRKLAACAVATHDIRDWSSDAPWMTGAPCHRCWYATTLRPHPSTALPIPRLCAGYFSFGVWSSIWLATAPMPHGVHGEAPLLE